MSATHDRTHAPGRPPSRDAADEPGSPDRPRQDTVGVVPTDRQAGRRDRPPQDAGTPFGRPPRREDAGAAPLLAALLGRAMPGLAVLDLGLGLYPWLPGALLGLPDAAALPTAERDLLRRFRQAGGTRPLFGLDPTADAALLAGAPAAWGEAAPGRLVCLPAAPPPGLAPLLRCGPPDPLVLLPAEAADAPGLPGPEERGRIILLLGGGTGGRIRGWTLVLPPEGQVEPVLGALRAAAVALAEGGGGWQLGGRLLSPRMASFALLAAEEDPDRFAPSLSLPAEALAHDGPLPAAGGRLPLRGVPRRPPPGHGGDGPGPGAAGPAVHASGALPVDGRGPAEPTPRTPAAAAAAEADPGPGTAPPRQLRLLLGLLPARPWTLRLHLHAEAAPGPAAAPPVLFLDGLRHPARAAAAPGGGAWCLEASIHPAPGHPTVLGLAMPPGAAGPDGLALARIELLP